MLAPVVIFVYRRPEHTKKTIESLSKNYLAKETEVFIYSDGPKDEKSEKEVKLVREYIDLLPEKRFFKSIKIIKSETNKGLANSIISGVSEIIEKYGKVIVLEDDLVSSKDFLQFMNAALEYYKDNSKIWSISGYNLPIKIPKDYEYDVYLSYRASSWGWATWKNRWEKVDWEVSDYDDFKKNKLLRNKLNRGGRDLSFMLDLQMQGKIDSWAIRWCFAQSKLDMLTVYPVISRIRNIGLDGTGTHSGFNQRYDVDINIDTDTETKKYKFVDLYLDKRILRRFRNFYMSSLKYILINIKKHITKS
jgi:hypothetical protein